MDGGERTLERKGVKRGRQHTLPSCVGHDRYPPLDQLAEREQGRLNGSFHWADDDEAYVKVPRYPRREVLFQLGALLPAELGQFRVVDGVVSC
jgi:hypothetical protein